MHALKNLELAHYVDRLQDENHDLRKLMGWLSGHEPQLRMMIEAFKRQDGEGLGANKVGEGSGENIPEPPKTHHKNNFPPKPNHLRNRLDTTPAPPIFPTPTNDLQKPNKFVSTSGKVFFGKESEKASEEKSVKELSGEKPSEQPQSKPKPKLVRFRCGYCGRERVTRMSFASRGSGKRGWQRSGRTRIGTTLPMVYLSHVCHCPGVKLW
jgi:hypothetical protein